MRALKLKSCLCLSALFVAGCASSHEHPPTVYRNEAPPPVVVQAPASPPQIVYVPSPVAPPVAQVAVASVQPSPVVPAQPPVVQQPQQAVVQQPPQQVIVQSAPPAPIVETIPAAPSVEFVWTPGYWAWNGRWVWVSGRYVRPPRPHAVWVQGHWTRHGHAYHWEGGHWR